MLLRRLIDIFHLTDINTLIHTQTLNVMIRDNDLISTTKQVNKQKLTENPPKQISALRKLKKMLL